MRDFAAYLASQRRTAAVWAASCAVFAAMGALYGLPAEPFAYGAALSLAALLLVTAAGYRGWRRRMRTLSNALTMPDDEGWTLPQPVGGANGVEGRYQALTDALRRENSQLRRDVRTKQNDALDYFTMWAHQIKTPIAAMRLMLQSDVPAAPEQLERELLRIEQYVGMVMGYLRLSSDSANLVLRRAKLDGVICKAVRRFADVFILKKIRLSYEHTDAAAVTDEKWLGFILGQLLSNAVKYTGEGGTITIEASERAVVERDTGCGIRAEDLPRIFDKGYNGASGRIEQTASGLGLYLCARTANMLGCTLSAQSEPGRGSAFTLAFPQGTRYE